MLPDDLAIAWRFVSRLPPFLRQPVDPARARDVLRQRLASRQTDFLSLVRDAIYADPASPYLELLRLAGCEYGDLETLVRQSGVEGSLAALYRQGVYLTVDEFKGRQPARRGSASVSINPQRLRNRRSSYHVALRTGGSRGAPLPILVDLAGLRELAVDFQLALAAHGGTDWMKGLWAAPGGSVVSSALLTAISFHQPLAKCFLYVDPHAPGLHARYRWSIRLLQLGGRVAGMPFPRPVHVPVHEPLPVARWMAEVLRGGRTPLLSSHPSAAARLCEAALAAGLDLEGARFSLRGEPITAGRLAPIRRAGAKAIPVYGTIEAGAIANGCAAPAAVDDVHLLDDVHAVWQVEADSPAGDLPRGALLLSSLRSTARLILLNVCMGDIAAVERRACGCPLDQLGWTTHLHSIRSFEKLTAAGMTFQDSTLIEVLEEVLPARFGGSALDYQLIEDEREDGGAEVRLIVNPSVGPLDPRAVAETFLQAIGSGSGVERVMQTVWREAGVLRVEREPIHATAAGKVLHLHSRRRATPLPVAPAGKAR